MTFYRALVAVSGAAGAAAAKDAFARAGFETVAVTTFKEAVESLRSDCPDVLASSMRLGEFNGLHLALRARDLYPDLPILILGGPDDQADDAAQFGATFLPFSGDETVIEAASVLLRGRLRPLSTFPAHPPGV